MDYYSFPRKQLQALCKKHGIPANSTNVSMADALTALLNGNGNINKFDEGFQEEEPASQDRGDDSVLTEVSDMPRRCKQSKRLVIAKEDESTEEPVVIHIEETPVAPKGKGAKSANKTRERRSRTTARSRKVDIVTMDGSLHSSEVDESSDAVTAINSAKVERSGPVKGIRNARARMAKSCCRTDEIEDPEEKEEKTDETNCKLVEEVPETRTNGRSSGKKIDKVQVEEALEDSSSQGENDACKKEMTPICRRSRRAKASKVVDTHPSQNRSSSIKKTGNAESIKKTDGSLHSSEVEESSDVVPALNSAKFERTGPIRGSRNARTFMTKSFFRTNENEHLERLEDTQGSDEKKEKSDEIKCKLVEEAHKNRTKGRSSGRKDDKVEVKEGIEDRSTQGENNASRKEITPICRRSTRASKVVDTHPSQNRSSSVKKIGNAECIKKTPGTMSKARKVKLSPMAENFTDNEEEGDQAEEVVKIPTKKSPHKEEVVKVPTKSPHKEEVSKSEYSCNNDVKSSVMTRRALRSNQKDSTGILNKDALEESTSKVKRMLTHRGRKPVRNVHQGTGSETQEESNSDSEGSDVKQERESYGKITRKAVRENLEKDEHKCTEEIEANLNVKEDGVIENEAREDVKSIDKTESEEMKCEIILQPELNMSQIFDQKHVSSGISRTQNTENKSIEEISNTSKSSKDQSATMSESYGSRIVKELNVCSGKVSMKHGIASAGMTPLSRPGEGKFNSLPSVDQLGTLKCSTASIVAEESPTKNDALSSLEPQVGELIGIEDGEVGEKMVSDGVTVAESHNATRSVIMHVQLKGEEDALLSHIVDSVKVEETKESLHHNNHKVNNFIQELKCRRDLSSISAEVPSPVEKKDDIMHSESDRSSIEAIQNPFEVHEKVVNAEPGNVAGLAVNISAEECLDAEAVYSSDLKIAGKQTELQLIPTNLVEKTNWNTTEANLQSSSFLIDEVSALECTKEENQDAQDCNFATGFANSEGQLLEVSETIQSAEYCQGLVEEILSDLENTEEEILDVQDSDLYFKVVSDISQIQDRQVTGFANAEGQLIETSEKFQSAEDCQVPGEEILSDLENTQEENLDVQDSDLSFKVVSDICQVQDKQVTGFANAESQVLDSSEKIQRAEYCQGMEEEILSDLENTEGEILDVQDSDLSFKVVSDISQIQDRQVTGFANAEGQVTDFANAEGEDCQDVMEEILNDLDNSEVEYQDDHSFKVVPNILQVTGFANSESKAENGGVCKDTQEGKLQTLTSLPEETKDSATEESEGQVTDFANAEGEDCQDVMEEILNDLDNSEVENQDDHSFKVVPNILQVTGFANSQSKAENGGVCKDTQEGKLQTLTSLPEEMKDSATEESIGYQEACNDTMEGKHPSQTSSSDNASEAEPVERVTGSSAQAVGEVEIGNFSCKLDGRQKEACQAQVCISHQRSQDSGVHPEVCSNTSCFAEVLVHSNEENSVIAIQKHGTSDNDRKTIDKSKVGKLDVLNENSSSRSNNVPLLCAKEEMNLQNQISEKQVPSTADSIHRLESDMMATVESFEIGNVGRKLGVEEATCAFPEEKYLPSFATKGSEQTDIKEPEFAVEASYKGKMPIVGTLCEKINSMALDGASKELAASDSPLALVKPDQVEKAPNTIIKDSRQQRVMLSDLTDQSRKDGQNTIDDGFQIAPLESAGCGLQIGKENPPDLDALSLRKLRALVKEKKMLRNNVRKEKERFVLRDLTSIELEERKNVSDNTRL